MKIRLLQLDGKMPNIALMKISTYYKRLNYDVDWYDPIFDRDDTVNKQKAIVNRYFNRMGERCKTLLRLFYYEGLTLKERQTQRGDDNDNVVKSQKSRCLKNGKDLINKHED